MHKAGKTSKFPQKKNLLGFIQLNLSPLKLYKSKGNVNFKDIKMLNSTLIEIFKTFEKTDLKRFEDFLKSPYFNKKTNVVALFNIIKTHFPDYKTENLKKETVWKKLYPDKNFNYGVMKNFIHDLTKLAENYLQTQILESGSFKKTDSAS